MKRLTAQIGITCFSVLAVAFYLPERVKWILLCAAVLAAAVLLFLRCARKTIWLPVIALTAAVGFAVNLGYTYLAVIPVQEACAGSGKHVEATLTEEAYKYYSFYYYPLRADRIDGSEVNAKLLLKTPTPIDIEPFDSISFTAEVHPTDNNDSLTKGFYLSAELFDKDYSVIAAEDKPLFSQVIRLRSALREAIDDLLPVDAAALCKAVFIGDKYALDASAKTDFRYAGASYFIVVSGMHFSIIVLMLYRLLEHVRLNRFVRLGMILPVIVLYMALTGFQPSVVRSGVMMTVYVTAQAVRRINDAHTSLGLAGMASVLIFSPYGAGSIGLILSFAATFAIITWSEPIYRKICIKDPDTRLKRIVNAFLRVLATSLAANLLVFPISVYVYNAFSTVTLISALLLYVPIELILILSLFVCLLYYLGPLRYAALLLSWPLYGLAKLVLWIVGGLASLPFSYIFVGHDFFYLWMTITILMALIVILFRSKRRLLPYAAILSAIILIAGTISCAVINLNTVSLRVFSSGEGLTAALAYHGQTALLCFDAPYRDSAGIIRDLSRSCDAAALAVCTRSRDLQNYLRLTDRGFDIERLMLYDRTVKYEGAIEVIPHDAAPVYLLDDGISLTVAERYGKLMSYLHIGDTTVLVLPPGYPYRDIPAECRSADVIVLSKVMDGYTQLSCDTLIISNTDETIREIREIMKDRCRTVLDTGSDELSIRLE